MSDTLLLLLSTVLVNNFVLVQFLGLCPFMGVSSQLNTALGMALATTFVLTLSSVLSYMLFTWVLLPLQITFLKTIAFIVIIAAVVQFTELMLRSTSALLHRVLGIFLPLITTNCAVLGIALLNIQQQHSLLESFLYGLGAAVGFSLVLVLFAALRPRIQAADIPRPFQGSSIGMISAGLMSLAFLGFTGITG